MNPSLDWGAFVNEMPHFLFCGTCFRQAWIGIMNPFRHKTHFLSWIVVAPNTNEKKTRCLLLYSQLWVLHKPLLTNLTNLVTLVGLVDPKGPIDLIKVKLVVLGVKCVLCSYTMSVIFEKTKGHVLVIDKEYTLFDDSLMPLEQGVPHWGFVQLMLP